jgi:hypothetical protein
VASYYSRVNGVRMHPGGKAELSTPAMSKRTPQPDPRAELESRILDALRAAVGSCRRPELRNAVKHWTVFSSFDEALAALATRGQIMGEAVSTASVSPDGILSFRPNIVYYLGRGKPLRLPTDARSTSEPGAPTSLTTSRSSTASRTPSTCIPPRVYRLGERDFGCLVAMTGLNREFGPPRRSGPTGSAILPLAERLRVNGACSDNISMPRRSSVVRLA